MKKKYKMHKNTFSLYCLPVTNFSDKYMSIYIYEFLDWCLFLWDLVRKLINVLINWGSYFWGRIDSNWFRGWGQADGTEICFFLIFGKKSRKFTEEKKRGNFKLKKNGEIWIFKKSPRNLNFKKKSREIWNI